MSFGLSSSSTGVHALPESLPSQKYQNSRRKEGDGTETSSGGRWASALVKGDIGADSGEHATEWCRGVTGEGCREHGEGQNWVRQEGSGQLGEERDSKGS